MLLMSENVRNACLSIYVCNVKQISVLMVFTYICCVLQRAGEVKHCIVWISQSQTGAEEKCSVPCFSACQLAWERPAAACQFYKGPDLSFCSLHPLPSSVVVTQLWTACCRALPEQQQLRPAC